MIHSKPVKRRADTSPSVPAEHGGEEASAKRHLHKPLPSLLQKLIHGDGSVNKETQVPCKELAVDLRSISERSSAEYDIVCITYTIDYVLSTIINNAMCVCLRVRERET
jgi:hypothetical protein